MANIPLRLLSTIDPPPPGFTLAEVVKRDLLGGPVAVYCSSFEQVQPRVEFFVQRVVGVILTPGESFKQQQLGPLLWQLWLPDDCSKHCVDLVMPLLGAVELAVDHRERATELGNNLERLRYDLETLRGDYLRVTAKLQDQVRQLIDTQCELSESEAELRAILDLLPQRIYATNEQGVLLLANAAFAQAQGVTSPAELIGRPEQELRLPMRWLKASREADVRVRANLSAVAMPEMSLISAEGEVAYYEAVKLPLRATSGAPSVLTVLHDISGRHAIEAHMASINEELERRVVLRTAELEASNQELESFSYSVSHDLRSPLRAIMGFSQILEEEAVARLSEEERDMLRRIQLATARMSHLIDDLLTLARISKMRLQREPVELDKLARQALDRLQDNLRDRVIRIDIEPGLRAHADPRLVQLLLEHLLGNAIKFTRGRDHALIEFGAMPLNDETIYFVRDNGAGFEMRLAEKLFTPFQRLHTENEFEGSGIGLATARRAVNRHGGRIWAEASPERGATFYFTLPEV